MDNKNFWKRIDDLVVTKGMTYRELSEASGIPYITIMNQKNQYSRLPKLENACALAHALNTNVEYLLTGEAPASLPVTMEGMDDIVEALAHATLDERNMVRRLLNIREKGKSSSSREDEA